MMDGEGVEKEPKAEEGTREKEEAEERKRRFLMVGKSDKKSGVKDEKAKLPRQSNRGSRKNCHLVKRLAKRFKGVEKQKESTSSSSEDTDGYDESTSDSNTPSGSPCPPTARKPNVTRREGSNGLGNPVSTDSEVKALESRKTEIEVDEVSGQERDVVDTDEREVPSTTTSCQDYEKGNIEEEEKAINKAEEECHNQELEEQKKNDGGEEDGVGVNENKLVSEKEADCSEDLASADLCEVPTSFFLSILSWKHVSKGKSCHLKIWFNKYF